MHRMFSLPGCLPRLAGSPTARTIYRPTIPGSVAALEMHPLDTENRLQELKDTQGIGYCNITKCCTKVCPEHITITDNAIIPLKERVVD